MIKFLILNYFKLSKFMNIRFKPFTEYNLLWQVYYKINYNDLTDEQKILSDKFTSILTNTLDNQPHSMIN